MPKDQSIEKVLVIGSGPIIIGQGAEFDYSGTQACKVFKEEGIQVVLVNNNPATIMTDANIADAIYMEPLLPEVLEKIIAKEKPDAIIAGMGGQTALNLVMKLSQEGILERYGVKVIGTQVASIEQAESREAFKQLMAAIGEPCVESETVSSVEDAAKAAEEIGYPVVVRPAYTLGGTGGGIASNLEELEAIAEKGLGFAINGQVLVEKCISGWKEIEYEMMRDGAGSVIAVCNMENIDPVGIHTGDSIVVAPSQTLSDHEYQMLRNASIKIVSALNIQGGCNVQIALDPKSLNYSVIEVNPRVSRSSALASKATGYPIAKVAAKIALGYNLHEILNDVTGATTACFEPALDYCVVKIPRFAFDKFKYAQKTLGTMMMATGEVMAIAGSFEAALMKAIRSMETGQHTLKLETAQNLVMDELMALIEKADDLRLFYVAELMRREVSPYVISEKTGIDYFFTKKIGDLVNLEKTISGKDFSSLSAETLRHLKNMGFSDQGISELTLFASPEKVRASRLEQGIGANYKMVDTCAAEMEAQSPYYYATYDCEGEATVSDQPKILVLGSGPIRIGQGVEFDYCTVGGVEAFRQKGYETLVINNNPETVSTDFNISDQLYFEPITLEDVLNVVEAQNPVGVVVQFGGQTALKLAKALEEEGVKIVGTSFEALHMAEDREAFNQLANRENIPCPIGKAVFSMAEGLEGVKMIGFPLIVRPSYVLGGLGMKIVQSEDEAMTYLQQAFELDGVESVLMDSYLEGLECEVDGVCDGEDVFIPGIMEHLEGAGVHSGDSMSVYPPMKLTQIQKDQIAYWSHKIPVAMGIKGLFNIQFVIHQEAVYVIEVNPRSSRTVPFISKVTGVPLMKIAVAAMLGDKLSDMPYGTGVYPEGNLCYIKMPVFSHGKIPNVDVRLGPEMKSTGELLSMDLDFKNALYKGFLALLPNLHKVEQVYMDCSEKHLEGLVNWIENNKAATAHLSFITNHSSTIAYSSVAKAFKAFESEAIEGLIRKGELSVVASLFDSYQGDQADQKAIRSASVESRGMCMTHMDTFEHFMGALLRPLRLEDMSIFDMNNQLKDSEHLK